ncbi:MAG: NosD domain-containing protein, partial [Candidatus Thorarchaeota archaeon]
IHGENLIIESNDFVNLPGNAVTAYSTLASHALLNDGLTIHASAVPDLQSFDGIVITNSFVGCGTIFRNSYGNPVLFSGNTIEGSEFGVCLDYTSGNWIINNTIQDSSRYGIYVTDGADGNTFYGNSILDCGIANAYDEGESNVWDNGLNQGNYWDDYNGSGEYAIPGPANSTDRWPGRAGAPYLWVMNETEVFEGTNHTLIWKAFDSDPLSYEIRRNDTLATSGSWDGGDLTISLDGLEAAVYAFTATVFDEEGNNNTAMAVVRVISTTTPPTPSTTPTQVVEQMTIIIIGGTGGIIVVIIMVLMLNRRRRSILAH